MEVTILRLDNFARGICYINDKITFVPNTLPDELVEIELTKETKKYNEAKVIKFIKTSNNRITPLCPFYNTCGGCDLEHLNYNKTIEFKKTKLSHIFKKHYSKEIEVVKSIPYGYRNKITLKVIDKKIGYYEEQSHNIVPIDDCLLASNSIRKIIPDLKLLNINNGEIIIRSNYNDELLIWIKTNDNISPNIDNLLKSNKIVGIILNDQTIYGESNFVDIINNKYYKISYDSFFQINTYICGKIFDYINNYFSNDEVLLDLYCGVGTLGIGVSSHIKKLYGIEIIPNAIKNAISNSKVNKLDNAYYLLGKCEECIDKINDQITTILVDPPRAGLDKHTLDTIISFKPNKIIYVSCDPMTLARDLELLNKDYNIIEIKGFDMFPYTVHVETVCILNRKTL